MDAIVLVGGEGTRLRPLTYDCPKPMLPVVDRPLVAHVLEWLGRHGVTRAVLSLGYRPDAFAEAFPSGEIKGVELVYAVEPEPLGTAGALRFAAELAGVRGRFVALNGDILTDFDLGGLERFHAERGAEASLFLKAVEDPAAFGVVPTAPDGQVIDFLEKPTPGTQPTNLINAGVYLLEERFLDRIAAGRSSSIERETFPRAASEGLVYGLSSDAYWMDAGTPEKYLEAQLDVLRHRRDAACLPDAPEVSAGIFAAADAVVAGTVRGVLYAGPGCLVEAGAEVADSVLGPGVHVSAGAVVERCAMLAGAMARRSTCMSSSIAGPGAEVGEGARLANSLVRGRALVPAGVELVNAQFPST